MNVDVGELRVLAADLGKASMRGTILASRAIRKTAHDIEGDAKQAAQQLFRPPPTGDATGATANSIHVTQLGPLTAEIGPTTSYSVYLEHGTYKMQARPFMGPAFDRRAPMLEQALQQITDGLI